MLETITLYSLAWDNDGGCGCQIFATRKMRDLAFREALMSYMRGSELVVSGKVYNLEAMDLDDLANLLDNHDRLGGARYALETHCVHTDCALSS